MYDGNWPMRQASLLFAGVALQHPDYVDLWSTLPADSDIDEVIRNFFIRQPLLWLGLKGTTAFFWQRKGGCPLFSRMLRTTGDGP